MQGPGVPGFVLKGDKHMNHILKKIFSIVALFSTTAAVGNTAKVAPLYSIRSQGVDAARELAGWTQQVNLFDKDGMYGTFAITPEYSRSFKPGNINKSLFNTCDNCPTIKISGSSVANRGASDWLADYFYLPTDYQSTLKFNPVIDNYIVDLNFFMGLDACLHGLFFRLHLPVVYTRWDLDFCETASSAGTQDLVAGYFAADPIPRADLLANFSQFAAGLTPTSIAGTTMNPLRYAKFNGRRHTQTRLAELQAVLGWDFLQCEDYHIGLGARFSAPTGNAPQGELLFEPIAGNGHHWELGAQLTSHYTFWRSCNENHSIGFYMDANITHLFKAKQKRTFDLKCKPLSRYMLAEKLVSPTDGQLAGGATEGTTIPNAQFDNEFTPVANLTTLNVKVSAAVQGDIAAQFTYVYKGFNWDLGYNFWGRSCEKFDRSCKCPTFPANTWALKGDAHVYGFSALVDDGDGFETPVALSATESGATIHGGTNAGNSTNTGIDNKQLAWNGLNNDPLLSTPLSTGFLAAPENQTNTSINPVFIDACNIDYVGVRGISNKIYTHLSYQWAERCNYTPYLGIGGFAEFGSPFSNCKSTCSSSSSCSSSCASSCRTNNDSCITASLSQWGIWLKGGVSFN